MWDGTIKKAEHWQIDAFELWCWRRLLRVLWKERRSNQSILKEISPKYSWEGLMLKLKLQYLDHLMQITYSLECFNGGTWWSGVDNKKVKEKKRLIFSGLCRKPIRPLTQGLHCSWRHQLPSRGDEGTECLLQRVLEAPAGEWARWVSMLQRISWRERN